MNPMNLPSLAAKTLKAQHFTAPPGFCYPMTATLEVPALQVIDITKHYDVRVRKITSSMEFRTYISVLRGKRDRQMTALDKVNFTIAPGEVFGLLGPNGAGKTTLIKILSTLVLPDSGQALVFGTDVVKHPRAVLKKLQAVLAEGWGFESRLSGRQNLQFYATLYGIPSETAAKRIDELLEFCQLGDAADSDVPEVLDRHDAESCSSAEHCSRTPRSCSSTNRPPVSTRPRPPTSDGS